MLCLDYEVENFYKTKKMNSKLFTKKLDEFNIHSIINKNSGIGKDKCFELSNTITLLKLAIKNDKNIYSYMYHLLNNSNTSHKRKRIIRKWYEKLQKEYLKSLK